MVDVGSYTEVNISIAVGKICTSASGYTFRAMLTMYFILTITTILKHRVV